MCDEKERDEARDQAFHDGMLVGVRSFRDAVDEVAGKFIAKHGDLTHKHLRPVPVPDHVPQHLSDHVPDHVPDHLPQPIDALIDELRKAREALESRWPGHTHEALDAIGHAEDRAGEIWHELHGTADRVDWERGTVRGTEDGHEDGHDAF